MDVLVIFTGFATTVLLLHKYRKPIKDTQHPTQTEIRVQPQPARKYLDKILITLNQQPIPNTTKNYEFQFLERSLLENNQQMYWIYFLGCTNTTISNFLRCSDSSTDILDENKIISNDYLPNCVFMHSSFSFAEVNLYLHIGDLCCFIVTEKDDHQKIQELITNEAECRIFTGVTMYIHWNTSIKCAEQYSNYVHEMKQRYQLRVI